MQHALEHIDLTVTDTNATAAILAKIFDWNIRWAGSAMNDDKTIHLGTDNTYLAFIVIEIITTQIRASKPLTTFNHIGIQVDDLDAKETKFKAAGLIPYNHDDYAPGRRFCFNLDDELEIEVVSYH